MKPTPLAAWHRYLATRDADLLNGLLAEDAVFHSPALHAPQAGRRLAATYLATAVRVLGNPTFRYVGEWQAAGSAVLEFEVVVDGLTLNGVDIISWNENNEIHEFKVMVRPMKALTHLVSLMGKALARPEEA